MSIRTAGDAPPPDFDSRVNAAADNVTVQELLAEVSDVYEWDSRERVPRIDEIAERHVTRAAIRLAAMAETEADDLQRTMARNMRAFLTKIFSYACQTEDENLVRTFIFNGWDVNQTFDENDLEGWDDARDITPLALAAVWSVRITELLLRNGASGYFGFVRNSNPPHYHVLPDAYRSIIRRGVTTGQIDIEHEHYLDWCQSAISAGRVDVLREILGLHVISPINRGDLDAVCAFLDDECQYPVSTQQTGSFSNRFRPIIECLREFRFDV